MRYIIAALLVVGVLGCQGNTGKKVDLATRKDSISYIIGVNIGRNLGRDSIEINHDVVLQGLRDGGKDSSQWALTEAQMEQEMVSFQQEMQQKVMARRSALADKNQAESEKFLAENKTKEGVITLPSGLQYKVEREGNGPTPKPNQKVKVNYRGMLINGTVFDESYKRGEPLVIPMQNAGVIPGWTEALQRMKVGSKWTVYIPPSLGYGAHGAGNTIGPNEVLIFDLELLGVE